MAECKKCKQPISFKKVGKKFWPINLDGSEHDRTLCEELRCKRFIENGMKRERTRKFKNHYGKQAVTEIFYDLEGESLMVYSGPYLAYKH